MSLEIISVGSSSSGNSYIILAGRRTLILDAGLPAKTIMAALEYLGTDPADVDAVLLTHEHTDHVKSVRAVSRKCCNAVFYTSMGTAECTPNFSYVPVERVCLISAGDAVVLSDAASYPATHLGKAVRAYEEIMAEQASAGAADWVAECSDNYNNVTIKAFPLSHDAAEPLGFTVEYGGEKLAVVTDTGVITDEIFEAIKDADAVVFESNHDEHMLMFGEYPYNVKLRIKSDRGHLSNDYAGNVLARLLSCRSGRPAKKPLRIMLAHLSFHNNAPLFARHTVDDILAANGFVKGADYILEVAAKEGLTFMPSKK